MLTGVELMQEIESFGRWNIQRFRIIFKNGICGASAKTLFFILLTISLLFQSAWAGTAIIRLAWDQNTEPDLAGYRIYFGTSPRTGDDPTVCGLCGYSAVVDVGNVTTFRIPGLVQRKTYYVSATAYDTSGNESAFSGQVSGPAKEVYTNFDGDGKTDIAVYRPSTGVWYIVPSSGGAPYGVGWGLSTDTPVPGDFDGDGKTDIAVYRPSTGVWYIIPSSGGAPYEVGSGGNSTDVPVPGDYDGNGKTDIAVYRRSTGAWFVRPSGGGAPYGVVWGISTDIPVPGDYDGDGKTDVAVYRDGVWFVSPSGGGSSYATGWGIATDKTVPGDYDGDGKTDIAVYRPSTGAWYIIPSSGGSLYGVGWGGGISDVPLTTNPD